MIRQLLQADCADAAALHARCFTGAECWTVNGFAGQLAQPGTLGWVIEQDGQICALLVAHQLYPQAELLTVAVSPTQRRQGLAERLIRTLFTTAYKQKITEIFLEVAHTNTPALALYQRCGFSQTGLRRNYYAVGVDALLLCCDNFLPKSQDSCARSAKS